MSMHLPDVLVTLPRRAAPELPEILSPELAALVQAWSTTVETVPADGEGDFEYWVESAYRILTLVEILGPERVWVSTRPGWATSGLGQERALAEFPSHASNLGMQAGYSEPRDDPSAVLAGRYMFLESFACYAGRALELGGVLTHDEHDVEQVLTRMRGRGIDRFFLKGVRSKSFRFPLEGAESFREQMEDIDPWLMVQWEGIRNSVLVQEHVPMAYEYRTFVVGHEVVTGAGMVSAHTPLDNQGEVFSSLVQKSPGALEDSPVVSRPEVRDQLVSFAREVAIALHEEAPDMQEYVLDVALGKDGSPLVVELNALANAGLYACDVRTLTRARLHHHGIL